MRYTILPLLLIPALFLLPLSAETVTFDQISVTDNDLQSGAVLTQGLTFSSPSFHIINDPAACAGGCVDDGSQYLAVAGPGIDSPVTVTASNGQLFSLTGLNAARLFLTIGGVADDPNADTVDLLGSLSGGGTVSTSLTLPPEGAFGTFAVTGFTGLTSLTISGTGGGSDDASWAVDNLNVFIAPEPSAFSLAGLALVVLIAGRFLRRRISRTRLAARCSPL